MFAHFNWQATQKLSIEAGARYTDDKKDATIYRVTGNVAPAGIGISQFVLIDNGLVSVRSQEWSPKLAFDYQFTDTVNGYVQLSTGFRGGGFSPRPANALQLASFQPEFIDNFEVGVKSDWLNHRLRFNGDVYYMVNSDKQQAIADCAPCTPVRVNSFPTVNTGESRNWGIEAEILAEPVDNLRIDFSLGYQNYLVTDLGRSSGIFITVPNTSPDASIRGEVLYSPRTPKWNTGLGISVQVQRGHEGHDADAPARLHLAGRHLVHYESRRGHREPRGRATAGIWRIEWAGHLGHSGVQVVVLGYGQNLTDEYYFYGKLSLLGNSGREQGNPAPPRELGVNVRFNF